MRRIVSVFLGCLLAASPALAFTVMDGSEKGIDHAAMTALSDTVLLQLSDPTSVQLAKLYQPQPDVICGMLNAKNLMGGYAGFTQFKFFISRGKMYLGDAARC